MEVRAQRHHAILRCFASNVINAYFFGTRSLFARSRCREKYFARNTSSPEEEYVAENMERGMKEAIRMIKMLKGEKLDDDEQEEHWMDREEREAREQEEKNPEPTEDPEPAPPAATKVEGGDGEGV